MWLDPDVAATLLATPLARRRSNVVAEVGEAKDAPNGSKHWSASEILENLFGNQITKNAAKQLLMLRVAKPGIEPRGTSAAQGHLGHGGVALQQTRGAGP